MRDRAAGGASEICPRGSRGRRIGYVACSVAFALFWLTIGFGIIDLVSGFASGSSNDDGIGVLSAAYGVIAAIVLPAAFLVQLRATRAAVTALQQVVAVAVAFALAGVLALDPLSFVSVATLAAMLAILGKLSPEPLRLRLSPVASLRLFAVAAIGVLPWVVHGLEMAANGRAGLPPDESAGRPQAGGWAAATALALLVIFLGMLASTKAAGWRVPAFSAAVAALVFGLVSMLNPDAPGSVGAVWGALAIGWSIALTAATVLEPADTQPPYRA